MKAPKSQKGIALITVLFVFSIVTIIAINLAKLSAADIARISQAKIHAQVLEYALSAESYAMLLLKDDMKTTGNTDHLNESWAKSSHAFKPPEGKIQFQIIDLNRRFNINNIVSKSGAVIPAEVKKLERAFTLLGVPLDILNRIVDWVDSDDKPRTSKSEKSYYQTREIETTVANSMIASFSEIQAVDGLTLKYYRLLEEHITAVPMRTWINPNTATHIVKQSMKPQAQPTAGTDEGNVEYINKVDFVRGASSNVFLVKIWVQYQGMEYYLNSTIYRKNVNETLVLNRDFHPFTVKRESAHE